jgi:8-hydroxy-5-deazaflavin:NADPH oxidoreductase
LERASVFGAACSHSGWILEGDTVKIAIIGAGNVGSALGRGWATAGHEIVFGVRDPKAARIQEVVQSAEERARVGTVREAVASSEVVVLATPWPATRDVVTAAGPLSGRILVDATNPLTADLAGLVIGTRLRPPSGSPLGLPGRRW